MKITAVKSGWFRDRVKVVAEDDEFYKSTTGNGEWWLRKGQAITIKVPKSKMLQIGEDVSFEYCVQRDADSQIPWKATGLPNLKPLKVLRVILVIFAIVVVALIINACKSNEAQQIVTSTPNADSIATSLGMSTTPPVACTGDTSDLSFTNSSYALSDLFPYNYKLDVYGLIENKSATCSATNIVVAAQLVDSSKKVVEEQNLTLLNDGNDVFPSPLVIQPQKTGGYKNTFQVYQALAGHDEYQTKGWLNPGITFQTHILSAEWVNVPLSVVAPTATTSTLLHDNH